MFSGYEEFICDQCGEVEDSAEALKGHIVSKHSVEKISVSTNAHHSERVSPRCARSLVCLTDESSWWMRETRVYLYLTISQEVSQNHLMTCAMNHYWTPNDFHFYLINRYSSAPSAGSTSVLSTSWTNTTKRTTTRRLCCSFSMRMHRTSKVVESDLLRGRLDE